MVAVYIIYFWRIKRMKEAVLNGFLIILMCRRKEIAYSVKSEQHWRLYASVGILGIAVKDVNKIMN